MPLTLFNLNIIRCHPYSPTPGFKVQKTHEPKARLLSGISFFSSHFPLPMSPTIS
jgi:hypothetical protein